MQFGFALLAVYALLIGTGWRWEVLSAWQDIELYKQLTGFALVALIIAQWRLTMARAKELPRRALEQLRLHRLWGVPAPLLIYLHAESLGHAYVRLMVLGFLGLILVGLSHGYLSRLNRPLLMTAWLIAHTALAAILVPLVAYHAFNAFYYE